MNAQHEEIEEQEGITMDAMGIHLRGPSLRDGRVL
jgi:hypothetical protein